MKNILYLCMLLCFALSCTEKYDIEINKSEKHLVVDGIVTNLPGPYYVRLTWSQTTLSTDSSSHYNDGAQPVKNASITISDNAGTIDTLVADTSKRDSAHYNLSIRRGYYKTTKLQGVAGRTYTITVLVDGKTYTASSFMTPITYTFKLSCKKRIRERDGQTYYAPLLYYTKTPEVTSYFAFTFWGDSPTETYHPSSYGNSDWKFSILSDENLNTNINGVNLTVATSASSEEFDYFWSGYGIALNIFSLTKEGYTYYNELIQQFKGDGGAYKPAPASPKGNISNGALGFFSASAMAHVESTIPYNN